MWNSILAHLVRRALPGSFTDPEEERTAVEAAECGIRYAARLSGMAVLILGMGIGATLGGVWLMPRVAPPPEAVRVSRELGMETAQLRMANRDLQQERDALLERVAALEARTAQAPARSPVPQQVQAFPALKGPPPKPITVKTSVVSVKQSSATPWKKPSVLTPQSHVMRQPVALDPPTNR